VKFAVDVNKMALAIFKDTIVKKIISMKSAHICDEPFIKMAVPFVVWITEVVRIYNTR
jgi:hypothetical protein